MARKILLADDSVTAQNMGRKILADAGYEVITVNNGSAALKKIAELKPDVIILDVYMPGYSGLEVCQRLKDAQETSRVPVLLTVGKLEPFKPEESKRVRADGFIVKPFEASELLSSLSKLEDKIVPRAESSKPGRFARVTASIEEGRFDRTMATDEDNGWKNRISFPPKKKEKAAAEDEDDAATASSRERKSAEKPQPKKEEPRVDLGALAPEGLPKDVTPEEIAALAAAAAQVKGKILDSSLTQSPVVEVKIEREFQPEAIALPQESTASPITFLPEPKYEDFAAKTGEKKEKEEDKFDAEKFAVDAQKLVKAETIQANAIETVLSPAGSADVVAETASFNQHAVASPGATLGDEFSARGNASGSENQPVTMALAGSPAADTRWQAVSLALAPEDTAISLEQEMQKACAAVASANNSSAVETPAIPASTISQSSTDNSATSGSSASIDPSASETRDIPSITPEVVAPMSASATSSTEAIRAAVQGLEMVAEPYTEGTASAAQAESAVSLVSASEVTSQAAETSVQLSSVQLSSVQSSSIQSSSVQLSEASTSETRSAAIEPPTATADFNTAKSEEPVAEDRHTEDRRIEDRRTEDQKSEDASSEHRQDTQQLNDDRHSDDRRTDDHRNDDRDHSNEGHFAAAVTATPLEKTAETQEMIEPAQDAAAPALSPVPEAQASIGQASSDATSSAKELPEESRGETIKKETDEGANTAAAWASWRRIRESDSSNASSETSMHAQEDSAPQESAAMAVAAGAEKTPNEASPDSDSPDIANIVDSVLADLRPKIFEEISRKMGKKK